MARIQTSGTGETWHYQPFGGNVHTIVDTWTNYKDQWGYREKMYYSTVDGWKTVCATSLLTCHIKATEMCEYMESREFAAKYDLPYGQE